ncbi:MAG: hypothetical protein QOF48_4061 [Verrucomicrobiota bacterium]|jgi:hypothetical protein
MNSTTTDFQPSAYSRAPGVLAALFVTFTFGVLYLFKDLPAASATYVIGTGSVFAITLALVLKNRGRWPVNTETIYIGGLLLQYLLVPSLYRFATSDLTQFVPIVTQERLEVQDGYAGGMLVALFYTAIFLLASSLFRDTEPPRHSSGVLDTTFFKGGLWIVLALAVILWLDRFYLLRTGSFYQLNRTDFQEQDWRYSIMAQMDSTFGPLVAAYFFARWLLVPGSLKAPVFIYLAIDAVWNFASGSRERALMTFICLVMTYIVAKRRIPAKFIAAGVAFGLFLIGFMDYYRYAMVQYDASQMNFDNIGEAVDTAREQSDLQGIQSTFVRGLGRLNDLESVAAIYWWVPDVVPYENGNTYWNILAVFVPRFIWTDKPPISMPINNWVFSNEGGSSPTTTMGEGYLNFGWPGVALAAIVSAFLLRWGERFLLRYSRNSIFLPVYVTFLLMMSRMHTQPLSIWVGSILKVCLLLWLGQSLTRPIDRLVAALPNKNKLLPPLGTAPVEAIPLTSEKLHS